MKMIFKESEKCSECNNDFKDFSNKSKLICYWNDTSNHKSFDATKWRQVCDGCYSELVKALMKKEIVKVAKCYKLLSALPRTERKKVWLLFLKICKEGRMRNWELKLKTKTINLFIAPSQWQDSVLQAIKKRIRKELKQF